MLKYTIIGASGHGRVIADIIRSNGQELAVFLDDNPELEDFEGKPVLSPIAKHLPREGVFIVGIGNNHIRQRIVQEHSLVWKAAIHPQSILASINAVKEGTAVVAGAIVNPGCQIGRHVILNPGCSVDHDCHIGDFVHISPHATLCGNVTVGEGSHIGAGATIIQGIRIGARCTIGAGAVIIRDVPDGVIVVGNPGHILDR